MPDKVKGLRRKDLSKISVLSFIHHRKAVTWSDLVAEFGYTYWGAIGRLRTLHDQNLIQRLGQGEYCLAENGYKKLSYFGKL